MSFGLVHFLPPLLCIMSLFNVLETYKVCTTKHVEGCETLEGPIQCDYSPTVKDCLLKIINNKADFAVISGSDVYAAAHFAGDLLVLGEFRDELRGRSKFKHELVVFASNAIEKPEDLRGEKLCHPGFNVRDVDPNFVAQFDRKLSQRINNNSNANNLESLSTFSGPSCIPGKWVENSTLDRELKSKNKNLVELCSSAAYTNNKKLPFDQSLECLLENKGIALTTFDTVEKYKKETVLLDYHYICPNDTICDLHLSRVWSVEYWDIIVAKRDTAENGRCVLKNLFEEWIKDGVSSTNGICAKIDHKASVALREVIFPDGVKSRLNFIDSAPSITEYISDIPASSQRIYPSDQKKITWCTTSPDEEIECKWFSAKHYYGHLDCLTGNISLCITSISQKKSDFASIPADYAFSAKGKNLYPILGWNTGEEMKSVIVVDDTFVKEFDDLKNQTGCFIKHGISWLSFMEIASSNAYFKTHATDELGKTGDMSLDACETDGPGVFNCEKKLQGGPLECMDKPGYYVVTNETDNSSSNFTVLCKDGSLLRHTGLNVNEDCYISVVSRELIFTRKGEPLTEDIIKSIFSQLNFSRVENIEPRVKQLFEFNVRSSTTKINALPLILIMVFFMQMLT